MAILSVDLAFRRWSDLGLAVMERQAPAAVAIDALPPIAARAPGDEAAEGPIHCEVVEWNDPGRVEAETLAGRLNHLCNVRGIRVLMLDGPQAWKSRNNGLEHARVSERHLNTVAKTGLPGVVKPATYRRFAEFCVDVYDGLCRRGWRRFETHDRPGSIQERILVESYPFAAWKALGLKPLPSKARAQASDMAEALGALRAVVPLSVNRAPNHDQLQAIVGGLPGLALEEQNAAGAQIVGQAPRREDGQWREGFIVLPVAPKRGPSALRWMN